MKSYFAVPLLLVCIAAAQPAHADHFSARREGAAGQERGTVVGHGMDLFQITTAAGGVSPAMRAEIIAKRLEELANRKDFSPWMLSIGLLNGEVVIQDQDKGSQIVATVDRRAAQRYPGAGGSVERLARWWLALLQDHLSLANGRKPMFTAGTMAGQVFQKLYEQLGSPTEPVKSEEIERSIVALADDDRQVLAAAAGIVPGSFHPARVTAEFPLNPAGHAAPKEGDEIQPARIRETAPSAKAPRPASKPDIEVSKENRGGGEPADLNGAESRVSEHNESSVTVGGQKVMLSTDPQSIPIGKKTVLRIRLSDMADSKVAPGAALMRGWLSRAGDPPAASIPAVYDRGSGEYRLETTFPMEGDYRLTLGVITESQETFKAMFDFPVRAKLKKDALQPGDNVIDISRKNTRRSGPYLVTLTLDPLKPPAGRTASFQITVIESPAVGDGKEQPLSDAKVAAWFVEDGQQTFDEPPIKGRVSESPGAYGWRIRFSDPGRYRMVVEISPIGQPRFKVEFPVEVTP